MGCWCISILAAILVVGLTLLILWFVAWNFLTSLKRKFLLFEGDIFHFFNQGLEVLSNFISGDKTKVAESLHNLMQTIQDMLNNLRKDLPKITK